MKMKLGWGYKAQCGQNRAGAAFPRQVYPHLQDSPVSPEPLLSPPTSTHQLCPYSPGSVQNRGTESGRTLMASPA